MTLNTEEMGILTSFLDGHGIADYVFPIGSENRYLNIQTWLNTKPDINDFEDNKLYTGIKQVFYCLSFEEKFKIFSYKTANDWYVDILKDIKDNIFTDNLSKVYIDKFSQRITNMKILNANFNEFLLAFITVEDHSGIEEAFYLMEKQGLINASKIPKMQIELVDAERYLALQLSELPTVTEIETALS